MRVGTLLRRLIAEGRVTDPASPKGRVLVAAARLFRRQGYNRTTVRDLAAEVGILSGSLFHHFGNKDEILLGVMTEVVTAMEAMLQVALAEAETPRDKVRALIDNELRFLHGKTGDAAEVLIYEWRALPAEHQRQVLAQQEQYFRRWDEVLEHARDEGIVSGEPQCLRQLLHGAIVWTAHWYDPNAAMRLDQLVDQVLYLALKGDR